MPGLTMALTFRIPSDGIAAFQNYETRVLPLLAEYGGALQRRLRSSSGMFEFHVVHFATAEGLARYRADPRRSELAPLFERSGATVESIEVEDVR